MLIDFHTHTSASDGALTPGELLQRAAQSGLSLLAITDHDTVAGYRALAGLPVAEGAPRLIAGIEYSCCWSGTTIHILGLGMDCDHPAMREGLERLAGARHQRARQIACRLEALGFPGALAGALEVAGPSQVGRPHFAAWLVSQGHVDDHNEAFDRYLGQGKTGDVKAFWPTLQEVTGWIVDAGGVAVLAHPLKYRFTGMKLRRLTIDFRAAGGGGIEITCGVQPADQTARLARLAVELGMEVSVGSDFHRDATYGPRLGMEVPGLPGLRGVWERWSVPQAAGTTA